tara:strand:+ start:711 stop:944 length:234 start_codon:yes stop_codon:yes gene_type:complete
MIFEVEKLILDEDSNGQRETLGGYSTVFTVDSEDDLIGMSEAVGKEISHSIQSLIDEPGIYGIGWVVKKYLPGNNIH